MQVNKTWVRTLIDTDVTVNFLSSEFMKKAKILLQKKSNAYAVTDIDEKSCEYNKEMIDQKIEEIRLQIEPHIKNMQFNMILTEQHDVILELSWLKDINSKISFQHRTIDFSTGKLVYMSKRMHESRLEICTILINELNREIWENSEQVKIL